MIIDADNKFVNEVDVMMKWWKLFNVAGIVLKTLQFTTGEEHKCIILQKKAF